MTIEELTPFIALGATVLAGTLTFIVSLVKAMKEKNAEKVENLLLTTAQRAIAYAETLSGVNGTTKKAIALIKMNQEFTEKKVKFNANKASETIDALVSFTNQVNAKSRQEQNTQQPVSEFVLEENYN